MNTARAGQIVHVGNAETAQLCRPALVLVGGAVAFVRVFGLNERIPDEWGDVRHMSTPVRVPTPPLDSGSEPTSRLLDSWHHLSECTQ